MAVTWKRAVPREEGPQRQALRQPQDYESMYEYHMERYPLQKKELPAWANVGHAELKKATR